MAKTDWYVNSKGEQIDFEVKVYTRPNLRDGTGEMLMYIGKGQLETMFDKCVVDPSVTSIHFEYPERWCNILELRAIPTRMLTCFPNLEKVTIVTHSVYIIQCVQAKHIGIYDDASKYPETGHEDLNIRFCNPPDQFTGLWVATPKTMEKVHG